MSDRPIRLTRVHHRILKVLEDGKAHPVEELVASIGDEYGTVANLRVHIHCMRRILLTEGKMIVFISDRYAIVPIPEFSEA